MAAGVNPPPFFSRLDLEDILFALRNGWPYSTRRRNDYACNRVPTAQEGVPRPVGGGRWKVCHECASLAFAPRREQAAHRPTGRQPGDARCHQGSSKLRHVLLEHLVAGPAHALSVRAVEGPREFTVCRRRRVRADGGVLRVGKRTADGRRDVGQTAVVHPEQRRAGGSPGPLGSGAGLCRHPGGLLPEVFRNSDQYRGSVLWSERKPWRTCGT